MVFFLVGWVGWCILMWVDSELYCKAPWSGGYSCLLDDVGWHWRVCRLCVWTSVKKTMGFCPWFGTARALYPISCWRILLDHDRSMNGRASTCWGRNLLYRRFRSKPNQVKQSKQPTKSTKHLFASIAIAGRPFRWSSQMADEVCGNHDFPCDEEWYLQHWQERLLLCCFGVHIQSSQNKVNVLTVEVTRLFSALLLRWAFLRGKNVSRYTSRKFSGIR